MRCGGIPRPSPAPRSRVVQLSERVGPIPLSISRGPFRGAPLARKAVVTSSFRLPADTTSGSPLTNREETDDVCRRPRRFAKIVTKGRTLAALVGVRREPASLLQVEVNKANDESLNRISLSHRESQCRLSQSHLLQSILPPFRRRFNGRFNAPSLFVRTYAPPRLSRLVFRQAAGVPGNRILVVFRTAMNVPCRASPYANLPRSTA